MNFRKISVLSIATIALGLALSKDSGAGVISNMCGDQVFTPAEKQCEKLFLVNGFLAADKAAGWNNCVQAAENQFGACVVKNNGITERITEDYLGFLGRAPEPAGLAFWSNQVTSGNLTILQADSAIGTSPESCTRIVTGYYASILHRAPDAGGLAYWVTRCTTKQMTSGEIQQGFYNSPEFMSIQLSSGTYQR